MSQLAYTRIRTENDIDIPFLMKMYRQPGIARYLAVSEQYFRYVAGTDHVYFFKIHAAHQLVGTLHLEQEGATLSLALLIFPEHQGKGLGASVIRDVQSNAFGLSFDRIEAAIDQSNTASIRLFEHAGFTLVSREDELLHFTWPNR